MMHTFKLPPLSVVESSFFSDFSWSYYYHFLGDSCKMESEKWVTTSPQITKYRVQCAALHFTITTIFILHTFKAYLFIIIATVL